MSYHRKALSFPFPFPIFHLFPVSENHPMLLLSSWYNQTWLTLEDRTSSGPSHMLAVFLSLGCSGKWDKWWICSPLLFSNYPSFPSKDSSNFESHTSDNLCNFFSYLYSFLLIPDPTIISFMKQETYSCFSSWQFQHIGS